VHETFYFDVSIRTIATTRVGGATCQRACTRADCSGRYVLGRTLDRRSGFQIELCDMQFQERRERGETSFVAKNKLRPRFCPPLSSWITSRI
jgi:hypothetical protein